MGMAEADLFAPMRAQTLKENVSEVLSEAIITGKMRPGERLNESELARQLQVSRAPIREALQRLQEQGLVVSQPRRGMFVVSLDEDDLQKINSLRLVLEAEALRLAQARLTPVSERKLRQMVSRIERHEGSPAMQVTKLDLEFHRAIWALTGNEYLERMLTSLTAPLFAYAVITMPKASKLRMILDSHRPLLEFLQGKAKTSAEQIMRDHLSLRWTKPDAYSSYAGRG